jgi:hypothetical protein
MMRPHHKFQTMIRTIPKIARMPPTPTLRALATPYSLPTAALRSHAGEALSRVWHESAGAFRMMRSGIESNHTLERPLRTDSRGASDAAGLRAAQESTRSKLRHWGRNDAC